MDADFKADSTTKKRLFLSRILTNAKPDSTAIVFFGDSITDGNCSTPDTNNRWPDHIAERLQAEGHPNVAVVNEAYSGDRVLTNGMGTNALSRFDMSVLSHPRPLYAAVASSSRKGSRCSNIRITCGDDHSLPRPVGIMAIIQIVNRFAFGHVGGNEIKAGLLGAEQLNAGRLRHATKSPNDSTMPIGAGCGHQGRS
jgi:hypothetical protein